MQARRQKGISLLEVLLVVVIAATMVTGAVMYFTQTISGARVSQAAALIQQINKAGYEWLQLPNSALYPNTIYPPNFSGLNSAADGNGLNFFNDSKLIPCENKSCFTNPWGGAVTVTSAAEYPQYMLITFQHLPSADCAQLRQRLLNIAPQGVNQQNVCTTQKGISSYQVYL